MKDIFKRAWYAPALLLLCIFASDAQGIKAQSGSAAQSGSVAPKPESSNANAPPRKAPAPLNLNVHAAESAIDASIPDDPAVDAILAPYSSKVRELDVVIGKLEGDLLKRGIGAGSLGNFVADALRTEAAIKLGKPVLLTITNSGGLRKNQISAGEIRAADVYELLPFENALVAVDLNGEQLLRFLKVVVEHGDAQSGARIKYRTNAENKNEIVSVKLGERDSHETEINPASVYTIVTIDYLLKVGGSNAVLQESKNIRPLNVTMRDAVLQYVKAETAAGRTIKARLDERWNFDRSSSNKTTEDEQP